MTGQKNWRWPSNLLQRLISAFGFVVLALQLMGINACQEPDADGDGYSEPDDCDDSDPQKYPGAPEQCDGFDSDCDGKDCLYEVTFHNEFDLSDYYSEGLYQGDVSTVVQFTPALTETTQFVFRAEKLFNVEFYLNGAPFTNFTNESGVYTLTLPAGSTAVEGVAKFPINTISFIGAYVPDSESMVGTYTWFDYAERLFFAPNNPLAQYRFFTSVTGFPENYVAIFGEEIWGASHHVSFAVGEFTCEDVPSTTGTTARFCALAENLTSARAEAAQLPYLITTMEATHGPALDPILGVVWVDWNNSGGAIENRPLPSVSVTELQNTGPDGFTNTVAHELLHGQFVIGCPESLDMGEGYPTFASVHMGSTEETKAYWKYVFAYYAVYSDRNEPRLLHNPEGCFNYTDLDQVFGLGSYGFGHWWLEVMREELLAQEGADLLKLAGQFFQENYGKGVTIEMFTTYLEAMYPSYPAEQRTYELLNQGEALVYAQAYYDAYNQTHTPKEILTRLFGKESVKDFNASGLSLGEFLKDKKPKYQIHPPRWME